MAWTDFTSLLIPLPYLTCTLDIQFLWLVFVRGSPWIVCSSWRAFQQAKGRERRSTPANIATQSSDVATVAGKECTSSALRLAEGSILVVQVEVPLTG